MNNDEVQTSRYGNQTVTNANINIDLTELSTEVMKKAFKIFKQTIQKI